MKCLAVLGLVLALCLAGCGELAPPFAAKTGSLRGCLQLDDGRPAAGVEVWWEGQGASGAVVTDGEGRFGVDGLPAGTVDLVALDPARAFGWSGTARILGGRQESLGCQIMAATACLSGKMQYDQGVSPPVEVLVDGTAEWTWSRADGSFEVQVPANRCYDLTFQAINLKDRTEAFCAGEPAAPCQAERTLIAMSPSDEPESRVWLEMPRLPVPVAEPGAAVDGTIVYVAGGHSCPAGSECEFIEHGPGQSAALMLFDFKRPIWSLGADVPTPRSAPTGAMLDGRFHLIGGFETALDSCVVREGELGCTAEHTAINEVYDRGADRWSTGAALDAGRSWARAVASKRAIHVIGGLGSDYYDRIGVLTPSGWTTPPAELSAGGYQMQGCAAGQRIFAFGGLKRPNPRLADSVSEGLLGLCARRLLQFRFDIASWDAPASPAPVHRASGNCVVLGEYLYSPGFAGGESPEPSLMYDIRRDVWTQLPPGPGHHKVAVLPTPHGLVMLGGGQGYGDARAEVFVSVASRFVSRAQALYAKGDPIEVLDHALLETNPTPQDLNVLCDGID